MSDATVRVVSRVLAFAVILWVAFLKKYLNIRNPASFDTTDIVGLSISYIHYVPILTGL